MKKLNIGLVGTGFISRFHFDGFSKNLDSRITGMCTHSNLEKLNRMCSEWGIKPYDSFEAMVSDPGIDALIIGSVNSDHYHQILMAIEAGKSVLVEKPVVSSLEQIDEIIRLASAANVRVMPAHNFVYRSSIVLAKELLNRGELGKVTYASFQSSHTISTDHASGWRGKKSLGFGGALMDSGHHQVYQSLYLLGMPAKLQAFKSNLVLNGMEGEDIAQLNLRYPDGTLGCVMQSWTSGFAEDLNGIRILGEKGQLKITDRLFLNGNPITEVNDYANSFENQALAFTDYILNGKMPLSTLSDARNSLQLILSAYESCEKENVISL